MADQWSPSFRITAQTDVVEDPRQGRGRLAAPWNGTDLLRLSFTVLLGVALLGASWYGAARQGSLDKQAPWIDLGIVAGIVFGAGNGLWVLQGRRRIGERRNRLIPFALEEVQLYRWKADLNPPDRMPAAGALIGAKRAERGGAGGLVRAQGMSLAHRSNCPLLEGKAVTRVRGNSRARCQICHPESA